MAPAQIPLSARAQPHLRPRPSQELAVPRASLPDSASSLGWSLCPLASPCESVSDFVYGSVSLSPDLFRRLSGPDVQLQLAHTCSPAASPPASVPARRITASRQLRAAGTGAVLAEGGASSLRLRGIQAPGPLQTQESRPPVPDSLLRPRGPGPRPLPAQTQLSSLTHRGSLSAWPLTECLGCR